MRARQGGVAYRFWWRMEAARTALEMSKTELAAVSGIPRSTFDNLQTSTRPPQARIVHALADALSIPRDEADELAGLRPGAVNATDSGVVAAIETSNVYSDEQKQLLLDLIRTIDQANGRVPGPVEWTSRPIQTYGTSEFEAR